MTSFSAYPNAIDGYSTLPLVRNLIDEVRAQVPNRLRDAIIKIEQELGIQPSGAFATVRARLDIIGDASATIDAHLIDPIDAHDASAISLLDTGDNYVSTELEGALGELASVLPVAPDVIGADNTDIPNTGIPNFVGKTGSLHLFNTSGGADVLKQTQPVSITGVHVIEVGAGQEGTTATLDFVTAPPRLRWSAPGDVLGTSVDITSLSTGDTAIIASNTSTKKIRIARSSASLPGAPVTDTFDVLKFDGKSGTFSLTGTGFVNTTNATRTSTTDDGVSRNQISIGGTVFPADKGTLVLQRKLRLAADEFTPIATLDLGTNFSESLRTAGQQVYIPTLADFDTITLFDRLPAQKDYETLALDADGNAVFENFDLAVTFVPLQIAKYLIPLSNPTTALNGTLESPTSFSTSEMENKVSAYRIVHYKTGETDFTGEPTTSAIFSISDALADADDGDNNVRMSNVYVDSDTTRPGFTAIEQVILRPVSDVEDTTKIISGIRYYNGENDEFDVEVRTDNDVFNNIYTRTGILNFTSSAFSFPTGDGYGNAVDVDQLFDDGYALLSDSNLPAFADIAFYLINATFNSGRRLTPAQDTVHMNAFITAALNDPFGEGTAADAYGTIGNVSFQILINSFEPHTATSSREDFVDESKRTGTAETFDFALVTGQFDHEFGFNPNGSRLVAWDPELPLAAGELQVGGIFTNPSVGGLVYPQDNFSTGMRPTQGAGTDYSAFAGDRTFQRPFTLYTTFNRAKLRIISANGSLSINDILASNASRPVKIAIKIPGVGTNSTGFLDIGKLFQTGRVSDDDGAMCGQVTGGTGDFTIPFTFGARNNADSGDMIAVRITYLGAELATAQTKIISSVELLPFDGEG